MAFSGRFGWGRKHRSLAGIGSECLLAGFLSCLPLCAQQAWSAKPDPPKVNHVSIMGIGEAIEVEIQTSVPLVPESQTIASPDRIVIDFPGALPATALRPMKINHPLLKAVRTGLFSADPPITRVVLDLVQPQPYRISSNGNSVTLKLGIAAGKVSPPAVTVVLPAIPAPPSPLTVSFQRGLLRIHAKGATLSEVLFEVQKRTGAEIPIPSGAEEEKVVVDLGPAPPHEVLAALLNGSRYNFIFVGDDRNHPLEKAILSVR